MNFLMDKWIPIVRKDETKEIIAFWEITSNFVSNPIVEVEIPRPDLKSAFYQFVIGILQVAIEPEFEDDWEDLWNNPISTEELKNKFQEYADCFEIDSSKHPFMQDIEVEAKEDVPVASLLINSPGQNTIKSNKDLFFKRNQINVIDVYWAALCLFSLQINAPSGGQGHRTGLRGGGPLTTLVMPAKESVLWLQAWLNVYSSEAIAKLTGDKSKTENIYIFPWMGVIKKSKENGSETYPSHCNHKQMYFSMPRRIKMQFEKIEKSICDISGVSTEYVVKFYKTQNYGINYSGAWKHPLSPYYIQKLDADDLICSKGKPEKIGYKHWLSVAYQDDKIEAAQIVKCFYNNLETRGEAVNANGALIWITGYDMDNMKARGWSEAILPFFPFPKDDREYYQDWVLKMTQAAIECSKLLVFHLKSSVYKAKKGNYNFIEEQFFEDTEGEFYKHVAILLNAPVTVQIPESITSWRKIILNEVMSLFDSLTSQYVIAGIDVKKIVRLRLSLLKGINGKKSMKELK